MMNQKKGRKISKRFFFLFAGGAMLLSQLSCTVKYSLSGASIHPDIQTVSVQYFPNRAPLVQPMLSQMITDGLKDKIQAQTRLGLVNGLGDVDFEGEITGYDTRPLAITGNELAARNRFTITVKVKYTNSKEPELSFDSSFSRYEDYDSSRNLDQVEGELMEKILTQIIDDIFNKAFVNW
jgi:hypothetical protein